MLCPGEAATVMMMFGMQNNERERGSRFYLIASINIVAHREEVAMLIAGFAISGSWHIHLN